MAFGKRALRYFITALLKFCWLSGTNMALTPKLWWRWLPCKAPHCLHPSNYSANRFHLLYFMQHIQMGRKYILDLYFIWTNKARIWIQGAAKELRMFCIRDLEKVIQVFGCGPSAQIISKYFTQWLLLRKAGVIKSITLLLNPHASFLTQFFNFL